MPKPTELKRFSQTFSLPVNLMTDLKRRSAETGENISRLVERGVREALNLPAPELPDVGNAEGAEDRGARGEVLAAMAEIGPLWASPVEIMRATSIGLPYVMRTLQRLRRDGKVFAWGTAPYNLGGPSSDTHADELPAHAEFPRSGDGRQWVAWGLKPAAAIWRPLIERIGESISVRGPWADGVYERAKASAGILARVAIACPDTEVQEMRVVWHQAGAACRAFRGPRLVDYIARAFLSFSELEAMRRTARLEADARREKEASAALAAAREAARLADPARAKLDSYPPPSAGPEFNDMEPTK